MLLGIMVYAVTTRLDAKAPQDAIIGWLHNNYNLPRDETRRFIAEVNELVANSHPKYPDEKVILPSLTSCSFPEAFF